MLLVLLVPSVCVTCAFGLYWTNDVSYALIPCDCIAVLCVHAFLLTVSSFCT